MLRKYAPLWPETRNTWLQLLLRRRRVAALAAAAAAAALTGCATPGPVLSPLPPTALGRSITVRQQVTARFDGHVRRMQVALEVVPRDLTLVGLTAVGQRVFTLSWNGESAQLKSRVESMAVIDPARILADLQLAYWPLSTLRAALPDDLRLAQYGTARVVWRDGELIWFAGSDSADRWGSTMVIYNATVGYRLTIRPLALDSNP